MDARQISWLFFGFSGRIGRAPYFLASLLLVLLQMFPVYQFSISPEESSASRFWAMLFWVFYFLFLWSHVALGAKRLHDMGKSGGYALLVPLFVALAIVILSLFPGEPGANQYGERANAPKEGGTGRE
ncbi:DUF805 domain-containing protein [Chelativorans sp. AA-79]|uniref:DUF805 domain-containing protein n=1 Tax=Chelativorans sp. AA-79 TaxID=3028735 RepID=UPI0023F72F90|nr:DUF805 domain-containing protein [Chelativorans sp. AA-79]WEX08445.1 DUF805 domain-containing protein [Chelativorans sp. AA-79]